MLIFATTGASTAAQMCLARQSHPRSSLGIGSCSTPATHGWSVRRAVGAYGWDGWARNIYGCPAVYPIAGPDQSNSFTFCIVFFTRPGEKYHTKTKSTMLRQAKAALCVNPTEKKCYATDFGESQSRSG